jgi:hypothetical protein
MCGETSNVSPNFVFPVPVFVVSGDPLLVHQDIHLLFHCLRIKTAVCSLLLLIALRSRDCSCYAFKMASLTSSKTTQSSPLKTSSMAKQAMSPALTRSRSRKVQPALKQRAEAFLAQAAADTDSTPRKDVASRKRKRGSVDAPPKPRQPLDPEAKSSTLKQIRKSSSATKARPKSNQERLEPLEDLVSGPLEDADDEETLMSKTQTKKALKAKVADDTKEPAEKRLKIFRKQAPKTFHDKLHRATSQRYVLATLMTLHCY